MRKLLRLLSPLADLVAGFHLRIGKPKLDSSDYAAAMLILRPGDVILSKEAWRPTNIFIKGKTKHAAMFVGSVGGDGDRLVEATYPVARYTSLISVWQTASTVVILRPTFADSSAAMGASIAARSFVGTPYDTSFSRGEDALYCSELIDAAYEVSGGSPLWDLRSKHLGLDAVILPDALRTSKHFRTVWNSEGTV